MHVYGFGSILWSNNVNQGQRPVITMRFAALVVIIIQYRYHA